MELFLKLISVDVLSRFIRVEKIKSKSAPNTKDAFMRMMKDGQQPKQVWIDDGTEFEGAFKHLCSSMGIVRCHTKTVKTAAFAERAIRSLKNIIYRYMEGSMSSKYIHKLQSFVKIMNSRENRSIHMAPKDVSNRDAIRIINTPRKYSEKHMQASFREGDYVRAVLKDTVFRKGYKPQFSREIYQVKSVSVNSPTTYTLQDKTKKVLSPRFYDKELIHYIV